MFATLHKLPVQGPHGEPSLARLPVNLFGAVMGIAGLSLAWRQAHASHGLPALVGEAAGAVAVAVFLALAGAYAAKALRHGGAVRAEFEHPVMGNFFATIAIGLLLLSAVLSPWGAALGRGVWMAGTLLTLALSYVVAQRFLTRRQEAANTVPPLLIPGVASLDVAVTGAHMPFAWAREVNLLALAVGTALAVALFVLIVWRLRHHDPMPKPMTPALLVLVAPFEVGFLAYVNMTGGIDMFASLLFYFGLFLFAVLAPRVFRRDVPFGVPWWAVSFPMAALSIAALRYADHAGGPGTRAVALLLLAALTVTVLVLSVRTLAMVLDGRLLRG